MGFWGKTKTDKIVIGCCAAYMAVVMIAYTVWMCMGCPGLELLK
jgi:hypothetical protein